VTTIESLPLAEPTQLRAEAVDTVPVFALEDVGVYYGETKAVDDVNLIVPANHITALIGPSGCGKSTVLRTLNRMNDLVESARVEGGVYYRGVDIYGPGIEPVEVRRRVGMVFQKPTPFPKSIFDNVAYGPRVLGSVPKRRRTSAVKELVEHALEQAALLDEVKDRLDESALSLSGGQQQRLCIARALAVDPDVLLLDEPCSALDPIATGRIEELLEEIKEEYTIVIVTHNMQQAARVSDFTAFFTTQTRDGSVASTPGDHRVGRLVEFDDTEQMFSTPSDPRTESYITGRVG